MPAWDLRVPDNEGVSKEMAVRASSDNNRSHSREQIINNNSNTQIGPYRWRTGSVERESASSHGSRSIDNEIWGDRPHEGTNRLWPLER